VDRSKALLWDVQNAIKEVNAFLSGLSEESYVNSPMARAAVERKLQIIGEALAKLSKTDPEIASSIPDIRQIIGFRNVLVHGYAVIENVTVYEIATQRLPQLEAIVTKLLDG
jgi:uncharacterized protein with HEPN domain